MTVYWTTSGGDHLAIAALGTPHPRLQGEDRVNGWTDLHPRDYSNALFALCVNLLEVLGEHDLLRHPDVRDAGISTERA